MFIGIKPKRVARKNFDSGTFNSGDEMLMKKFGTIGVILKNNRQNMRLDLCLSSYVYSQIRRVLKKRFTKLRPKSYDRVQHKDAPVVAQRQTMINPGIPPKIAPDKTLKKMGPGIANVWRLE